MSIVQQYTREALYKQYKSTNPKLAADFLGKKYPTSTLPMLGAVILASVILTAIIIISIVAVTTHGFEPVPNPTFYSTFFPAIGTIFGAIASVGLVMIAIWYCKRHNVLTEKLSIHEANSIAGIINKS